MARRVTLILSLALGAAVIGGAGLAVNARDSPPAGAPADGPYRLSSHSIWAGQTATLSQSSPTGTAQVDWGDGSVETVPGTAAQVTHVYETVGTFTPKVTIAGEKPQSLGKVTVSTVIGGYRVEQPSSGPGGAVKLIYQTYEEADDVKIWWGDGETSVVPASVVPATATHTYVTAGTFEVKAAPVNESGTATPRSAGKVTVQKDTTKPAATLTAPANPARAGSWATVTGKASDTGTGVRSVTLAAVFKRGTNWFFYNGTGWKKAASRAAATRKAKQLTLTPAGDGAWSTPFRAPADGTLRLTYAAVDKAGNRSVTKTLVQKIS